MAKKDDNNVSALRVIVYGEPSVKTIVPKHGEFEGKEVPLLTFKAFHPVTSQDDSGSLKHESTWYTVDCFLDGATYLKDHLKDGMVLFVSGAVKTSQYKSKDGEDRESLTIVAYKISLDLLQKGLKGFSFTRPPKQTKE